MDSKIGAHVENELQKGESLLNSLLSVKSSKKVIYSINQTMCRKSSMDAWRSKKKKERESAKSS